MPPRTLRLGDRGDDVVFLQNKLKANGINPGPSDGIFGSLTDAAVRRFQEREGLVVDGIVGPITWAALGVNGVVEPPPEPEPEPATARRPVLFLWGLARNFWAGLANWGICNTASRLPSGALSQHAYCNAIDIHHSSTTTMLHVALWAVHNRAGLGTARVIYNRQVWSADNPVWRPYLGPHPHDDHVHIDFLPSYGGELPGTPMGPAFVPGVVTRPVDEPPPDEPVDEPVVVFEDYPVPPRIDPPYDAYWARRAALLLWANFGGESPRSPTDEAQLALWIRRWRGQQGAAINDVLIGSLWTKLYGPDLRLGTSSLHVSVMHGLLHSYGIYAPVLPTGTYTDVTLQAVLTVQRRAGIAVNSVVDQNTWEAILWGPTRWPDAVDRLPFVITGGVPVLPDKAHLIEAWDAHIRVAFDPVKELNRRLKGAEFSLRRL